MIIESNENKAKDMAWFGHTITKLNERNQLLFGGAVETNKGVYSTTNDSYLINRENLQWTKIQSNFKRLRLNSEQSSSPCCCSCWHRSGLPIWRGLCGRQSCPRDALLWTIQGWSHRMEGGCDQGTQTGSSIRPHSEFLQTLFDSLWRLDRLGISQWDLDSRSESADSRMVQARTLGILADRKGLSWSRRVQSWSCPGNAYCLWRKGS